MSRLLFTHVSSPPFDVFKDAYCALAHQFLILILVCHASSFTFLFNIVSHIDSGVPDPRLVAALFVSEEGFLQLLLVGLQGSLENSLEV